jgi:hypothetical protein
MLAKSMLALSLVYHTRQIDVFPPPAGLAMRPVNAAGAVLARSANAAARLLLRSQAERKAPTSGQTGRIEAAEKDESGRAYASPGCAAPNPGKVLSCRVPQTLYPLHSQSEDYCCN